MTLWKGKEMVPGVLQPVMYERNPPLEGNARFIPQLGDGNMERLRRFCDIWEDRWVLCGITIFKQMVIERVRDLGAISVVYVPINPPAVSALKLLGGRTMTLTTLWPRPCGSRQTSESLRDAWLH
jgi:hypothetical protein